MSAVTSTINSTPVSLPKLEKAVDIKCARDHMVQKIFDLIINELGKVAKGQPLEWEGLQRKIDGIDQTLMMIKVDGRELIAKKQEEMKGMVAETIVSKKSGMNATKHKEHLLLLNSLISAIALAVLLSAPVLTPVLITANVVLSSVMAGSFIAALHYTSQYNQLEKEVHNIEAHRQIWANGQLWQLKCETKKVERSLEELNTPIVYSHRLREAIQPAPEFPLPGCLK